MSTLIALAFLLFPGMVVASWTTDKTSDAKVFLCESVVWSLLIGSMYAWLPGGDHIPIAAWTWILAVLSLAGAGSGIRYLLRGPALTNRFRPSWDTLPVVAMFALYTFILMVRAVIDWDAITYYLSVAIQFLRLGHASSTLYPFVSTVAGAPNTQPPIMPALYANALAVGQLTGGWPETTVRLMPLAFILGTYLAVRRLGQQFLPENGSRFAAFLWLVMPATIYGVAFVPLYLDLGVTFLATYFISALAETNASTKHSFRLGAIAATAALFKVDGFVLIALATLGVGIVRLRRPFSRVTAIALIALLLALPAALGLFGNDYPLQLWIGIAACAFAIWATAGTRTEAVSLRWYEIAGCVAGFIPGILRAIQLSLTVGSPAGYYIPALAHKIPASWHVALQKLNAVHVYSAAKPGLPQHYYLDLVLWWGFTPAIGLLAVLGTVMAIKGHRKATTLAIALALYDLVYLVMFYRYGGMRDLMPAVPLMALLATAAIRAIKSVSLRKAAGVATLCAIAPFAWNAQESAFKAPLPFSQWLSINAWNYASNAGLRNALCVTALFALPAALLLLRPDHTRWTRFTRFARFERSGTLGASLFITALACGIYFIPVWSAVWYPGPRAWAASVAASNDFNYFPVLNEALSNPSVRRLLTFKAYGVTWHSQGLVQRIDLADATDLAHYRAILASKDPFQIPRLLDVQAAILPTPGWRERDVYAEVLAAFGDTAINGLEDPLLGYSLGNKYWTYRRFFPGTNAPGEPTLTITASSSSGQKAGITLARIPKAFAAPDLNVTITALVIGDGMNRAISAQLEAPRRHAAYELSVTELIAALSNAAGREISHATIVELAVTSSTTRERFDFRSEGVLLSSQGLHPLPRQPFLLHPEWNVIAGIDLANEAGSVVEGFPLAGHARAISPVRAITIRFHPSAICHDPDHTRLSIEFSRMHGSKLEAQSTMYGTPALGVIRISPTRLAAFGKNGAVMTAIRIHGTSTDCRVFERLETSGINIARPGRVFEGQPPLNSFHEVATDEVSPARAPLHFVHSR